MNVETLQLPPLAWKQVGTRIGVLILLVLLCNWLLPAGRPLYPVLVALLGVFWTRSAPVGLLAGALFGALLISGGAPLVLPGTVWKLQIAPIFDSAWRISALLFTLILGGFVALLESAGGLRDLVRRVLRAGQQAARRMQFVAMGSGVLVFFDGLANAMLIGRLFRRAADSCGVSRAKLAYIADSTGSAVACISILSTWIAFQLAMISEGFLVAEIEPPEGIYLLFLQSIPFNFYCLFTLILLGVGIYFNFNPGPMARHEEAARAAAGKVVAAPADVAPGKDAPWYAAIVPIFILVASVPFWIYILGVEEGGGLFTGGVNGFIVAYGNIEHRVPHILVGASVTGAIVAACIHAINQRGRPLVARTATFRVFGRGVGELAVPVLVLIAAWMLSAVSRELGAAAWISGALGEQFSPAFLPAAIFLLGAVISFCTGTSWGTMAVLMPLAIPVIYGLVPVEADPAVTSYVIIGIAAVFSGAVFGDHCSPFSDTTIISSVAAGVDPLVHVQTQLPYAASAAGAALVFGFLPFAFGVPVAFSLVLGTLILAGIAWWGRSR